jgi:hypothetical protein
MRQGETLYLSWWDGRTAYNEPFSAQAAAALLHTGVPFEATHDAWELLKQAVRVDGTLVGRAQMNLDGFVEIVTATPQLVEAAPLPGLFRLDETHFGLALPYASHLAGNPGFRWDQQPPVLEQAPATLAPVPVDLSAHAAGDLRALIDRVAAFRAQAVVWDHGLGRRVFVLAALESLDAWPALIVTSPAGMWAWQRHLDLFGRTHALTHDRADVRLITYRDLARRRDLPTPTSIVYDHLVDVLEDDPALLTGVHAFDALADAYRIAVSSRWPAALADAVRVMEVLRPGEFRADVPLSTRYPMRTTQRAAEHVGAYLSVRTKSAETTALSYRRSTVMSVDASDAQEAALSALEEGRDGLSAAEELAEALEIISAGTAHATSPKLAAASAVVRDAYTAGRRVVVATRHRRSASLLRNALRPLPVVVADAADGPMPAAPVVVLRFEDTLPDLRSADTVVVVDYPWSSSVLERAVGAADSGEGPSQVTVLHMPGTVDDRVAMLAARRRELGPALAGQGLSDDDVDYLLGGRV